MNNLTISNANFKDCYIKSLKKIIPRNNKMLPRFKGVYIFEKFEEYYKNASKLNNFSGDVWLISDQHFNHNNIIDFSERPFIDKEDMENHLIYNHNQKVKKEDIVIFAGDFGFCNITKGKQILSRLNGYKILVVGNHDVHRGKFKDFGYNEVYITLPIVYNNTQMIITHFPFPLKDKNFINVHGHIHKGNNYIRDDYNSHFNVNCEFINYSPIHIKDIKV